ncbi:MAG: hypothetical protein R3D67_16150 [Hyphomicrobiaceae bacterium]
MLTRLDNEVDALMQTEFIDGLPREKAYAADVGYIGQSHFIEVPFEPNAKQPLARLYEDFESLHERINGLRTASPAKIVNLRTVHRARLTAPTFKSPERDRSQPSLKGQRQVYFPGSTHALTTAIHDRERVSAGTHIDGPAIIEQTDTTTLVPQGWRARAITDNALLIERIGGATS